ncbi:uncharacterized protein LOC135489168 [Lineus longissimus]|uniref:uncharacterized protein LOC135489168 n=1 Tax=Lineus longissimus TaxID=88925 RepID=UPI00315C4CCB
MSTDRRRLLFRAEPSVSTETEPESVFYDNPAYQDDLYEKPKVHGKHQYHVSWDIDGGRDRGLQDSGKSKSRDAGISTSRLSRFSSGYESKNSFNDTNDELYDDYDESRDVIENIRGARSNKYYPHEQTDRSKNNHTREGYGRSSEEVPREHPERSNKYYPREPSDKLYPSYNDASGYKDKNGYRDRNSNVVLDTGHRKREAFNREPSWKKQYRKGGAFYITIDSDDSSGYPSSGTYRPDCGSVTIGSVAGDRRRSFSLSPQSSDDRARAPYQTPSPRSRSPVGDRLTVEAAIHWPSSSPLQLRKDFGSGSPYASRSDLDKSSPYTSRKDPDRSLSHKSRRDLDKSSRSDLDSSSPFNSRKNLSGSSPYNFRNNSERSSPHHGKRDLDRGSPDMGLPITLRNDLDKNSPVLLRKDRDRSSPYNPRKNLDGNSSYNSRNGLANNSPLTLKKEQGSSSPSNSRRGRDKDSTATSILPLISGQGRGRSPISSTSTGSTSWRDNSSTLSITESFALQAKGYLLSRKLNDTLSSSGEQSWSKPNEQNQPLLFMPPGRESLIGKPLRLIESDSGEDTVTPMRTVHEENENIPLRSMPPVKSQQEVELHRKLSSTASAGSLASIFGKAHRKLSESTSGGSRSSIKRDSIIPMRERRNSSIFHDLNLTFREVAESEFDSETDSESEEDEPFPLENGGVANGSAVLMADGVQHHGRRNTKRKKRSAESPLPITSEDTEDMIVMIMSNRSPCVARFISMCGVFQLLCGFISMMSGASGYLSNLSIFSTGNTFDFPIGFYIGLFFAFSGGWGIKSSHTKRKCVNIMAAFSSAFSLMAALFILVLIAYPGAMKFSCNEEEKGLFIFHLVMFTTEIIFASVQCVMCAKSLMESRRTAHYIRNRDTVRQENANR